ncbi:MAG: hypothetical protein HUU38_21600 [Anaerolineales bacterium]|nr:hypothetical protein [Anaerolineales bacterium]
MTPKTSPALKLFLIAMLVALPCSFLAILTAPLHSPFLLQPYCPEGTTLSTAWDRASHQDPTETTLFVSCVAPDGTGAPLPGSLAGPLFRVYFPFFVGVILLLQIGHRWWKTRRSAGTPE